MGCLPSMDTAMGAGTRTSAEGNAYDVLHVENQTYFSNLITCILQCEVLNLGCSRLGLCNLIFERLRGLYDTGRHYGYSGGGLEVLD